MLPYVKSLPYVLPAISTMNGGTEEKVPTAPYTRKAPYQYGWDWGPRFVTQGVWQPVRLETWDAVRVENFHIHQIKISAEEARVNAELELEATNPATRHSSHIRMLSYRVRKAMAENTLYNWVPG